jgi:hypothetical protein
MMGIRVALPTQALGFAPLLRLGQRPNSTVERTRKNPRAAHRER